MPKEYRFTLTITIPYDEAKKNQVRDWLVANLEEHRANGTIKSASWTISEVEVPESGTLSPL